MARMIPSTIGRDTGSPGEHEVFNRLRDDPATQDWTVLHSFDLPRHRTQVRGEVDFVILIPGEGILCLEVKAHTKVARTEKGEWILGNDPPTRRSPFTQAKDNMFSVIEILKGQKVAAARSAPVWFAVMFTHAEFNVPGVEWNDWECLDMHDLHSSSIASALRSVVHTGRARLPNAGQHDPPGIDDCSQIADALRPSFEMVRSPAGRRKALAHELRTFTESQFVALDHMRVDRNSRVIFEGPAGTGKTLLAMEATRRACSIGTKTLLVCFNKLLGNWIKKELEATAPAADAHTIHGMMVRSSGVEVPPHAGSGFWNEDLPDEAILATLDGGLEAKYDLLIMDEAQDLLVPGFVDFLDVQLAGGLASGSWLMFGDFEYQAIYDTAGMTLERFRADRASAPVYSLRDNCRNTPKIASYVRLLGGLDPGYDRVLRPDSGPAPEMMYWEDREEQTRLLLRVLGDLLERGHPGEDIVVLAPVREGAASAVEEEAWKNRIKPFEGAPERGYIRYSTVHSFKGLEAPVVVLTDISEVNGQRSQALFYTGLTRATDRLIVLADELVRQDVVQLIVESASANA